MQRAFRRNWQTAVALCLRVDRPREDCHKTFTLYLDGLGFGLHHPNMFSKTRVFRRSILSTALIAGLLPTPSHAISVSDDPLRVFAQCAGLLEAHTDFARLWRNDPARRETAQTAHFRDLVRAVETEETAQHVSTWHLQAKAAQMALLWRAEFATTTTEATIASRAAARNLAMCTEMLPG